MPGMTKLLAVIQNCKQNTVMPGMGEITIQHVTIVG